MILFDNPASPYCRKVRMVMIETGLEDRVELRPAVGHPLDSGKMPTAENPLGKIPTLLRDDGTSLYDSRVICRYLDAQAGGTLYPEGRIWETLTLEATADGIADAALLMVYEARMRPANKQYPQAIEAQWAKIERALDALQSRWMGHLSGPFDAGHIACVAALGYVDFRLGDRGWRTGRSALANWFEQADARPSAARTQPHAP